jgi:hypothetical protein
MDNLTLFLLGGVVDGLALLFRGTYLTTRSQARLA